MKKEFIFAVFLIVIFAGVVKAEAVCSNSSEPLSETKVIELFERRTINGLGIGVADATYLNVIKKSRATLILEAKRVILSNNQSQKLEFASGEITVTLLNATGTSATVQVGGASGELEIESSATIGNYEVIITKIEIAETTTATLLVGSKSLELSDEESTYSVETIGTQKYLVELISASGEDAYISVSFCESGEVSFLVEETPTENSTNITIESNITLTENQTVIQNETIEQNESANETAEPECLLAGSRNNQNYCKDGLFVVQKSSGDACAENYECSANKCISGRCSAEGIVQRIISWFRNLLL